MCDTDEARWRSGFLAIARMLDGEFRLTGNQNLVVARISKEQRSGVKQLIDEYGLNSHEHHTGLRLHSLACVALPTCGLALAEAERHLPDLVTELEEVIEECGLRHDAITIRMTGCPNGCARPYIAEIAFVGRAPGKYNVYLGGGFSGQRLSKLYRASVKSEDIRGLLEPIIRDYAESREERESFGDFVIRMAYVKATAFHQDVAAGEQ